MIDLPAILNFPEKLLQMVLDFNKFQYFLLEGGRGGGKSWAIARFILYLCEQRLLRVICGREIQNSIEESVYQLFVDVIMQFELDFDVKKSQITHRWTGSTIRFKGLREQGNVNIKSLEGCDILWVEEAQSITKGTLDVIIPTVRKNKSKVFFSMNRHLKSDAVYKAMFQRKDCLLIHVDYFDNPFCPLKLKVEAEECRIKNVKEYNHIWRGYPLTQADEYLFNQDKLYKASEVQPFGYVDNPRSVMAVDLSGRGEDMCVAIRLQQRSQVHWDVADVEEWSDPDTDATQGRIVSLFGRWQPDLLLVDADGMGYPIYISLRNMKVFHNLMPYYGSAGTKDSRSANQRAQAYLLLADWIDSEWLMLRDEKIIGQLENIKKVHQKNGSILIQSKKDMKKEGLSSPDHADTLKMCVWGAVHCLGEVHKRSDQSHTKVRRINKRKRR